MYIEQSVNITQVQENAHLVGYRKLMKKYPNEGKPETSEPINFIPNYYKRLNL